MGGLPSRNNSAAFKAKAALAPIKGEKRLVEVAQKFDVHTTQAKQWRDQLLEGATGMFGKAGKAAPRLNINVKTLHAKNGQLPMENNLCPARAAKGGGPVAEGKAMIARIEDLPARCQAKVLGISLDCSEN